MIVAQTLNSFGPLKTNKICALFSYPARLIFKIEFTMIHFSAKMEHVVRSDNPTKRPAFSRKVGTIFVVIISLGLAVAIYVLVGKPGHIPPLPRVTIEEPAQAKVLEDLSRRVSGVELSKAEQEFVDRLYAIHETEAQKKKALAEVNRIDEQIQQFRVEAREFAGRDLEGYLLLGDYLADRFHRSLEELIKRARQEGSLNGPLVQSLPEFAQMAETGGGFLNHALERGVLTVDGRLIALKIAPVVVFRARWRDFARLPLDLGFSDVEKAAYFDFLAAFAEPKALRKRLAAIDEITKLQKSFDGVVARAIVMHEAGQHKEALALVEQTIRRGRDDNVIHSLARALNGAINE